MTSSTSPRRKGRLAQSGVQKAGTARPPRPAGGSLTAALASARHDPAFCVFRHMSRTMRTIAGRYDRALQEAGLTANQFNLLMTLARQEELTVGALAAHVGTDPSTIPRILQPLLAQGFVALRVGEDRRVRLAEITPTGTRQLTAALRHWDRVQNEIVTRVGASTWKAVIGNLRLLRVAATPTTPGRGAGVSIV